MTAPQTPVDAHLMLVQNLAHVVAQNLPWQSAYDAVEASARALAAIPAPAKQREMVAGLERCEFDDECDYCQSPQGGSFTRLAHNAEDCTEAEFYICGDCAYKAIDAFRTAPTPPTAPAQDAQGVLAALKLSMEASAWDGVIQLEDALANIDDAAREFAALRASSPAEPLSLNAIQAWAVRRVSAVGPDGVTDPVAFLEEGVRWGETQHGIVTKERT